MKAPVGDFPYVELELSKQVEFLCVLLLVRVLHGSREYVEGLFERPLNISWGRATARGAAETFTGPSRSYFQT